MSIQEEGRGRRKNLPRSKPKGGGHLCGVSPPSARRTAAGVRGRRRRADLPLPILCGSVSRRRAAPRKSGSGVSDPPAHRALCRCWNSGGHHKFSLLGVPCKRQPTDALADSAAAAAPVTLSREERTAACRGIARRERSSLLS